MVLIDQHAAHERVAFQRLRDAYGQRGVARQRLLFPLTVELDARAAAAAEEHAAVLDAVGFEVALFGERVFSVTSVPAELRAGQDPLAVLRQLVGELAEVGGSRAMEERMDAVFATLACHSVVRAGDTLAPQEVVSLLASLDAVDFRGHCPHGRPVLLRIQVDEIARRFGR
jgi:DNA mismatch repair protein MutL